MTEKEKAMELVDKYYQLFPLQNEVITTKGDLSWEYDNWHQAKQCAIIAVEEIIKTFIDIDPKKSYWENVKKEINLL